MKTKTTRADYLTGETGGRVDLENLWNFWVRLWTSENLRKHPLGSRVILVFSGQKPYTRIISHIRMVIIFGVIRMGVYTTPDIFGAGTETILDMANLSTHKNGDFGVISLL